MEPTLWWGHGFGFMWIFPILFFAMCMFFMRGMFSRGSPGCSSHGDSTTHKNLTTHEDNAHEILDKRFASGEISKEEYEGMKKSLGNETS